MNWFSKILLLANYFNSALLIIPLILIVLCYKLFNDVIIAMIYYAILGILLISILSGIFLNWATNSFKELSYTVNERLIDHGLITAFHWNEVDINYRLDFIYFKSNMCLEYLKMYLDERCEKEKKENEKRPLLSISQRFRREPKDEIKNTSDIAKKELIKISSLYVHKLMNRTLLHPVTGHRHATTGMCLCQLVQAEVYEETI
uniref:Uncharacterized protein LOC100366444 isoform X2 n=1 Tax=Saccoglossus kowalevskii TaxID=10224 RepID=A0ABM0M1K9_SACKO|nr:PREDICTED: uncharacterized protein LOC100366444 isoform X2 [Saccoglossus kowalevskii]